MKIFIVDDLSPENSAMLQALYSRSTDSVEKNLKKARNSQDFMKEYYVNYGDASIGDCGVTTMYIEGVSLLAAKAIQDNPLYSGQQTSSRYVDFSKQEPYSPCEAGEFILQEWMLFYEQLKGKVLEHLRETFPIQPDVSPAAYEKALKAREFDIIRGFLPAGVKTKLSWTTNLRQAYERFTPLCFHPLAEVQNIAKTALAQLRERYPSSFSHELTPEKEAYYQAFKEMCSDIPAFKANNSINLVDRRPRSCLHEIELYNLRPKGVLLPEFLKAVGNYHFFFSLDYGGFQDIQRHRNGYCSTPVINPKSEFNTWYLEQLPRHLRMQAETFIEEQRRRILALGLSAYDSQYYCPLGTNVYCLLAYSLPQTVYVAELRSQPTVHPTVRNIAQWMGDTVKEDFPDLRLYIDRTPDALCIKRGQQNITRATNV